MRVLRYWLAGVGEVGGIAAIPRQTGESVPKASMERNVAISIAGKTHSETFDVGPSAERARLTGVVPAFGAVHPPPTGWNGTPLQTGTAVLFLLGTPKHPGSSHKDVRQEPRGVPC